MIAVRGFSDGHSPSFTQMRLRGKTLKSEKEDSSVYPGVTASQPAWWLVIIVNLTASWNTKEMGLWRTVGNYLDLGSEVWRPAHPILSGSLDHIDGSRELRRSMGASPRLPDCGCVQSTHCLRLLLLWLPHLGRLYSWTVSRNQLLFPPEVLPEYFIIAAGKGVRTGRSETASKDHGPNSQPRRQWLYGALVCCSLRWGRFRCSSFSSSEGGRRAPSFPEFIATCSRPHSKWPNGDADGVGGDDILKNSPWNRLFC